MARAQTLPEPENRAETLLRNLAEMLYPLRLAIAEMQQDPEISALTAARRVSMWPEIPLLLKQIIGQGNRLRQPADMAAEMPEMDGRQRKTLERLLRALSDGHTSDQLSVRLMPKRGRLPAKVFLVDNMSKATRRASLRINLTAFYTSDSRLVAGPRSFKQERKKQTLRWLSTVLRARFPAAREVQAYWDARHHEVWVASSLSRVNKDMEDFLLGGGLTDMLADASQPLRGTREARHAQKLRKSLVDGEPGHEEARDVLLAMSGRKFRVPTGTVTGTRSGVPVDLHAERRIKRAFDETYRAERLSLDRTLVAGTMRPCAICARDLGLPKEAHRGPFWMSRAGYEGYDLAEVIDEDLDTSIGSTISKTREGKLSASYNTDSDSDAGGTVGAERHGKRKSTGTRESTAKRAALERPARSRAESLSTPASAPPGAVDTSKPLVRDFAEAFIGRAESNPLAARAALRERVFALLHEFNDRAWHRGNAYVSLEAVLDGIRADTGLDIARAIRVAARLGLTGLERTAYELAVGARREQVNALKADTLDAWRLLASLGLPLPPDIPLTPAQVERMLPASEAQMQQIGQPQVQQALQALMDESGRRFGAFMARLEAQPDARPEPQENLLLSEISRQGAMLRHSAAVFGWLPPQASPTGPLPLAQVPTNGDWLVQVEQLFMRGSASGGGNICWFDTLAQLHLDEARGLGGDHDAVDELARNLRRASDLLGLSKAGEPVDDIRGTMHPIACFLGVQIHAFRHQPDGSVRLTSAQTIGAPTAAPVYLYTEDNHFEPMWPRWDLQR